jgi:UDP-N-acetylmuramate--alanine ligase
MPSYFFCGIGGSGMLPLAMIVHGQGAKVAGSDRGHDQGRTPEKFDYLAKQGIQIVPQDGNGLTKDFDALIISSAVEDTIPEVRRAKEIGVPIVKRAELLAQLFNAAKVKIGIGGTSGKSTTTGMLAWILKEAAKNPTVMNGANFLNFVSPETPFASALVGDKGIFVTECDESDGSIILYQSSIAVLNNIALDHKPVEELKPIFAQFLNQSAQQVLNIDNPAVAEMADAYSSTALTVGIDNPKAHLTATSLNHSPNGISAQIQYVSPSREAAAGGIERGEISLQVIGRHNIENALCAIGAALLAGVKLADCCRYLNGFLGVGRRLQTIKKSNNISIIDDFAHNPDKINASLRSLNEFSGRLLVIFQMHGYGPFKLMKNELMESFVAGLKKGDIFYMPDVLYMGGTVDKSYTSQDFIAECQSKGLNAVYAPTREDIGEMIEAEAKAGDRIVIMGARDDTLTEFAKSIRI